MSERQPDALIDARRWFSQAREDLTAAGRLVDDGPGRVVCFLAHLAVEKAIKATLLAQGTAFRRVHDLFQLRSLLDDKSAAPLTDDALAALNPWVIDGRYPGDLDEATPELAADLVTLAGRTLTDLAAVFESQ